MSPQRTTPPAGSAILPDDRPTPKPPKLPTPIAEPAPVSPPEPLPMSVPPANLSHAELVALVWELRREVGALRREVAGLVAVLKGTAGRQVETLLLAHEAEEAAAESEQRISELEARLGEAAKSPNNRYVKQLEGEVEGLRLELEQARAQLAIAAKDSVAKGAAQQAHSTVLATMQTTQAAHGTTLSGLVRRYGWQSTFIVVATLVGQVLARWLLKGH